MLALIPLSLVLAQTQTGVLLRYNPPVGSRFKQHTQMTMKQSAPTFDMKMEQTMDMSTVVLSKKDDQFTLESVIDSMKMTWDPEMPGVDEAAKKMIGTKSQVTMDSLGVVRSAKSLSDDPVVKGSVKQITGALEGFSYPKTPVEVGSTWTATVDPGKVMDAALGTGVTPKITTKLNFRVIKITDATIDIEVLMDMVTNMEAGGIKVTGKGNGKGVWTISRATGLFIKTTLSSRNEMTASNSSEKLIRDMKIVTTIQ